MTLLVCIGSVGCESSGLDLDASPGLPSGISPPLTGPQSATDATPSSSHLDFLIPPPTPPTNDCCSQPGKLEECWFKDAEHDRVACTNDSDCPSHICDVATGLCTCDNNDECNDGVCTSLGLCGPSYCNGVYVCSCPGSCDFQPPEAAIPCGAYGLNCCDGTYPELPSTRPSAAVGIGFCTMADDCGGCNVDADCDDGVFCNGQETCVARECMPATDPCLGGDACTNLCNELADTCLSPAGASCDDGVFCNGQDVCDGAGNCTHPGDPCAANSFCEDLCNEATDDCHRAATTACTDGVACTKSDACDGAGHCVGTVYSCTASQCEAASTCDGLGGCIPSYVGTTGRPCDDGVPCSQDDACDGAGTCAGVAKDCTALIGPCANGVCNPATGNCEAAYLATGTACSDSNACTAADTCSAAHVCSGTARNCDDGNSCTSEACTSCVAGTPGCNPGGWRCQYVALTGTACDDGDVCTVNDTCVAGACAPGADFDCTALDDQCQVGACEDDGTGAPACVAVHMSAAVSCNADADGCTVADKCNGTGTCVAGSTPNCTAWSDVDNCRVGACASDTDNSYHCFASVVASGTACNDRSGCTSNDTCNEGGACIGASVVGVAGNCTPNGCQTASCTSTGDSTYTCALQSIAGCCLDSSDCDFSATCGGASADCAVATCSGSPGTCSCQISAGTSCTDFNQFQYPLNCYDGTCAANGTCLPSLKTAVAANDSCRAVFSGGAPQTFGAFLNTDGERSITVAGSTQCATNNYRSIGADCVDTVTLQPLGRDGKDVVYAFTYQTPAANQYQLYSYSIKVWSTFRANVYTTQDINSAAACPEGASGAIGSSYNINSERCMKSYAAAPDVSEESCWDNGNETLGQDGCYPYLLAGDAAARKCGGTNCSGTTGNNRCGYYWTRRFYPAGCCNYQNNNNCAELPACTGRWDYPNDPYNCDLVNPSWTYQYVTSHMIFPDGNRNSATKTVLIFVDGDLTQPAPAAPNAGSFYISVERKPWTASPCDRRDDDARVFDVTNASGAGAIWTGSLGNVVNSNHAGGGGSCGGYVCANTWSGRSAEHAAGTPNEFWPNLEHFKVQRPSGTGNSAYCVYTDESIPSAADIVFQVWRRAGGTGICDAGYASIDAKRNTHGAHVMYEFTANQNELYLLLLSEYQYRNRPCLPGLGDSCSYKFRARQGSCPLEYPRNVFRLSDETSPISVSGTIIAGDGDHYDTSNTREDVLYEIGNSTGANANVTFRLCTTGWYGVLYLYNSSNGYLTKVSANNTCSQFAYSLTNGRDYYVVVDKQNNTSGPYTLTMTW